MKVLSLLVWLLLAGHVAAAPMEFIRASDDGTHFVEEQSGKRFVVWGVNYDHDDKSRLLDEYWIDEWDTVVADFREIKSLGANCVRVHLQLGKLLDRPDKANPAAVERLKMLVKLAEETGLYLDITGLACYHKQHIPAWYDKLNEQDRWKAQAMFWATVAEACHDSPAIFCYDLMNEPILAGDKPETEWLGGELGGMFFVQRITRDLKGRTREAVAKAWIDTLVAAIRQHDRRHMVTVGVIPWVFVFGGGKPLFHGPEVGAKLDFVAVHFYPKAGELDKALKALQAYEVGKPLIIEEMFPLACSPDELLEFVRNSSDHVDGWVSFYWGVPAKELQAREKPTLAEAITADWLEKYQQQAANLKQLMPEKKTK